MKKALILLADGFEETEALTTHDIFTRTHEIETTLASTMGESLVTSSMGLKVLADGKLEDLKLEDYDFLILPGGKLGVENLKSNPKVIMAIKSFISSSRHVHAICAAPSILGELGYLDDKEYTCFPGFQRGNGKYLDQGEVTSNGLVTGHSMGYTIEFAEAIVRLEIGQEAVDRIYPGTRGKELKHE